MSHPPQAEGRPLCEVAAVIGDWLEERSLPLHDLESFFSNNLADGLDARVSRSEEFALFQARRYWDLGEGAFRREMIENLGKQPERFRFSDYLKDIPKIPPELLKEDRGFPRLVLIEPRVGLKRLCDLGGIAFGGDDKTFVAHDDQHREFDRPTWIRIQDGRKNRNRSARDCRKSFGKSERGLTARQGVCAYLQHPTVVSEATQDGAHVMDLSGSVHRSFRGGAACLRLWDGQPKLYWNFDVFADPECGSASRRECKVL